VCHGLLSLPHLPTRTNGRKQLVNYSQNHVVTSEEYLRIMQQKAMDREVVEHIRKKKKEKKNKQEKYLIY
jgi:hypothetical protein